MNSTADERWNFFQKQYTWFESLGIGLDLSRSTMPLDYAEHMRPQLERAMAEMRDLERGAIANADEQRMVGHYWLRNPALAPTPEIRRAIEETVRSVKEFAANVHSGTIRGSGGVFTHILLIGIGGSALGPQFVSHALGHPDRDKLAIRFLDNTDPDGFDRMLTELGPHLSRTLCLVISKSGGTKETRNGMLETAAVFERAGLRFPRHAVAITGDGSELAKVAHDEEWLATFPMWDWVGGRTSELSAVGLLPAALQGVEIDQLLRGAAECDNVTRSDNYSTNPAVLLACSIYYIGNGSGKKEMVVLPYKDRLELFARYLQQLVMESLGKEHDRKGRQVFQGLTVFGNKGSTDQHAYVQQLRDGLDNFFALFIGVLEDRTSRAMEVEPRVTSGDYLTGFLLGTRDALFERQRPSILLTLQRVDSFRVGALIALFERFVGLYASLINVNAYHQPGVEAGKKAAGKIITYQQRVLTLLSDARGKLFTVREIGRQLDCQDWEHVFRICEHLAENGVITAKQSHDPVQAAFGII
jgi:glucose-6-phosphate isomerase